MKLMENFFRVLIAFTMIATNAFAMVAPFVNIWWSVFSFALALVEYTLLLTYPRILHWLINETE